MSVEDEQLGKYKAPRPDQMFVKRKSGTVATVAALGPGGIHLAQALMIRLPLTLSL